MQYYISPKLNDDELINEYKQLIRDFGHGFHPDTPAEDYVPSLTDDEIMTLNITLDILHTRLGERIYTIGLEVFDE